MTGYLTTWADFDVQEPMDAAVVITTTNRPSLTRALDSVYAQDIPGRVHVLV